jgi:hypothetical protein
MASVVGGAISSGAIGAVTGLVTGGVKGMSNGFLMGAATGGVMGGLGMISPNGVLSDMGIGSQAAHAKGLLATGLGPKTVAPIAATGTPSGGSPVVNPGVTTPPGFGGGGYGGPAPGAATGKALESALPGFTYGGLTTPGVPAAGAAVGTPAVGTRAMDAVAQTLSGVGGQTAQAGTGGFLGKLLQSPAAAPLSQAIGGMLSGAGKGAMTKEQVEDEFRAKRLSYAMQGANYGYTPTYDTNDKMGVPTGWKQSFNYSDPNYGRAAPAFAGGGPRPVGRGTYQIIDGRVQYVMV